MRKILKIIFIVISTVFFLKWLLPYEITEKNIFYINMAYLIFLIPYGIYELKQIINEDKTNNTNILKERIILVIIAFIVLALSSLILNNIYKI
ncbi:hypothetical protein [Flavobacterium macrobrachii]|jgi:hypothetical protein|uniref:hypothetical protein n=1 Tax=Flavobacterium macrobrachii TaxID=591204 RepID=UPI0037C01E9B